MTCPGCGATPAPAAVPTSTLGQIEARLRDTDREWWDPDTWWCPSCLAAQTLAAHTDDCRCAGCRPPRRRTAA